MLQPPDRIEGQNVRIRRSTPADAGAVYLAAADPEVMRYMDWPAHKGEFDAGCNARVYCAWRSTDRISEDRRGIRRCSRYVRATFIKLGGDHMQAKAHPDSQTASANITKRIQELEDWRGDTLAHIRELIHAADPDIQEEWKWRGVPVWSHDGIVCTGETYKQVVKLTFARGASIKDPKNLFNSSLEGNTRRAIDIREGEKINEPAFKGLIRAAAAANSAAVAQRKAKKK